jgi:hypothetical protein
VSRPAPMSRRMDAVSFGLQLKRRRLGYYVGSRQKLLDHWKAYVRTTKAGGAGIGIIHQAR